MLTGRRRSNLVLIEQPSEAAGQWNPAVSWTALGQFWVSIEPNRGREKFVSDEVESIVTHTIRGDWSELQVVTAKMRVVYHPTMTFSPVPADARVFLVLAVMEDIDNHGDVALYVEEEGRRYGDL